MHSLATPAQSPSGLFDWSSPWVRLAWASILPASFVVINLVISISKCCRMSLCSYLPSSRPFLTVEEAESYEGQVPRCTTPRELCDSPSSLLNNPGVPSSTARRSPQWFTSMLCIVAVLESVCWLLVGVRDLAITQRHNDDGSLPREKTLYHALLACTWMYASVMAFIKRAKPTAPLNLFALYFLHFCGGVLLLGGAIYDASMRDSLDRLKTTAYAVNVLIIFVLIAFILSRPLGIPSAMVDWSAIVSNIVLPVTKLANPFVGQYDIS